MTRFTDLKNGWRRVGKTHYSSGGRGQWDVAKGERKKGNDDTLTSLFITEFGDKWKAKDLFFELKEFGEIEEVVIPPKRDNRGHKYGFVCFLNAVDEELLAVKVDNVILEGRKLFANLPRFQRFEKSKSLLPRPLTTQRGKPNEVRFSKGKEALGRYGLGWVDKRSFVDVMLNRKDSGGAIGVATITKSFTMSAEDEDLNRYGRAFTGFIKDPAMASGLKKLFIEEGIFTIRVTVLGPNLCLLEDLIFGEVEIFIEERRDWWMQWFSNITPWKFSDVDAERFAWISVRGIPCHAWGIKLFKIVAGFFGAYIKCDDQTFSRGRMDEARLFIKSRQHSLINEACMASMDGTQFRLFVNEVLTLNQDLVSGRSSKVEEGWEDIPSSTEDRTSGEEEQPECEESKSFSNNSDAQSGNEVWIEGCGTAADRTDGDVELVNQKGSGLKESISPKGNTENTTLSGVAATVPINVLNNPHAFMDLNNSHNERGSYEECGHVNTDHSNCSAGSRSEGGPQRLIKEFSMQRDVCGPVLGGDKSPSPISFDSACRRVTKPIPKSGAPKTTKKKKKKKCIQECGEGFVPNPPRFTVIEPRMGSNSLRRADVEAKTEDN